MTTDQGNKVVLVIPPRRMEDKGYSLSIPVNAVPILKSEGKDGDFILEPGDVIVVPERPSTITVRGGREGFQSIRSGRTRRRRGSRRRGHLKREKIHLK
jgi:hypothetical protein